MAVVVEERLKVVVIAAPSYLRSRAPTLHPRPTATRVLTSMPLRSAEWLETGFNTLPCPSPPLQMLISRRTSHVHWGASLLVLGGGGGGRSRGSSQRQPPSTHSSFEASDKVQSPVYTHTPHPQSHAQCSRRASCPPSTSSKGGAYERQPQPHRRRRCRRRPPLEETEQGGGGAVYIALPLCGRTAPGNAEAGRAVILLLLPCIPERESIWRHR